MVVFMSEIEFKVNCSRFGFVFDDYRLRMIDG